MHTALRRGQVGACVKVARAGCSDSPCASRPQAARGGGRRLAARSQKPGVKQLRRCGCPKSRAIRPRRRAPQRRLRLWCCAPRLARTAEAQRGELQRRAAASRRLPLIVGALLGCAARPLAPASAARTRRCRQVLPPVPPPFMKHGGVVFNIPNCIWRCSTPASLGKRRARQGVIDDGRWRWMVRSAQRANKSVLPARPAHKRCAPARAADAQRRGASAAVHQL